MQGSGTRNSKHSVRNVMPSQLSTVTASAVSIDAAALGFWKSRAAFYPILHRVDDTSLSASSVLVKSVFST